MTIVGKSRLEENIAEFLKSKGLDSASLILLDLLIPFKRPLYAMLSVSEPLVGLVFGESAAEKIAAFSSTGNSLEDLKKALERGAE